MVFPKLFISKRGLSPLVATIILVAFAVALGAMIMNWTAEFSSGGECDGVLMKLVEIKGKPVLCYDSLNSKLRFIIENTGTKDIKSILLRLINGENFEITEKQIPDSGIKKGEVLKKDLPYSLEGTEKYSIAFIPSIISAEQDISCPSSKIERDSLESC